MPNTYSLISSSVLGSNAASVTFSNIPSLFTDLVLRSSARSSNASNYVGLLVSINATSANNSYTWSLGTGASTLTSRDQYGASKAYLGSINGANSTSSTFAPSEWYIPNYSLSALKASGALSVFENDIVSGDVYVAASANLYSDATAITSLTISASSGNLVATSSFYLYGIKSS